jgi:hypothetical protein
VLVRIHAVIVYRRLTKLNHVLQLPSAESMSQMAIFQQLRHRSSGLDQ